ncbi:hypothetical protein ACQJBY_048642 [Aegilops geniculata]
MVAQWGLHVSPALRNPLLPGTAEARMPRRFSALLFFSSSVARKSRKIGQRWFHIPLLHYKSPLSRIAMGALDGGLDIPLSDKRFAGFKKDEKQLDTEIHRNYIYEDHVADYMKSIADEEPEKYQLHFSEYIKKGIAADDMEALYKKVHAAIRADPTMAKSTKEPPNTHKRYNFKKH